MGSAPGWLVPVASRDEDRLRCVNTPEDRDVMKKRALGLLVTLLAPGVDVLAQEPGSVTDLIGDWACYGYGESDAGMYQRRLQYRA